MPIYEYHCTKCQKTFERFQKITERPLTECPDCKGKVERLISQTSFTLRGAGWYKDGYSSAKPEAKEAKTGEEGKKEEKKPDKNETKDSKTAVKDTKVKTDGRKT